MSEPADVVRSYLASFAGRDPDAIVAHVGADFVNEHASALGSRTTGRDEYRRRLPGFLAQMPDLRYEVTQIVAEGAAIAAAYVLRATPGGRPVEVRGVMLCAVEGDVITRRTDYWDSLGFLRQTGQA